MTYKTARNILRDFVDDLPEDVLKNLNGGIMLQKDTLRDPDDKSLYTLGHYHYDPYGLGRYITVYYGSFIAVYGNASFKKQKRALYDTLYHELTHHLECLAGDNTLDKQDEALERLHRNPSITKSNKFEKILKKLYKVFDW